MEQQKYLKCLEIIEGHLETHIQIHPEERSSTDQSTNNTEDTKVGKTCTISDFDCIYVRYAPSPQLHFQTRERKFQFKL